MSLRDKILSHRMCDVSEVMLSRAAVPGGVRRHLLEPGGVQNAAAGCMCVGLSLGRPGRATPRFPACRSFRRSFRKQILLLIRRGGIAFALQQVFSDASSHLT